MHKTIIIIALDPVMHCVHTIPALSRVCANGRQIIHIRLLVSRQNDAA